VPVRVATTTRPRNETMEDRKSETPTTEVHESAVEGAEKPDLVPPAAETFEHQLKRLVAERNAARAARPGFYR